MPTAAPIPEKSIAVMPFENLSEDKANAYFADGIQDEILTRLSKNAVARVSYYSPAFENKYALKIELDVAF
jgi:TolB-like protein